jgi:pSer/pThr/pTyr-binding forkhead associated (FHA) protein
MAIWKLTIEDDEGQKTVVPLVRDEYTIGRREGHTIRLTERNVSRDHAKIRRTDDGYVVEDLGSYNGIFVNGHRVAEAVKLQSGDLVLIGDYRIEANSDEAVAARAISSTTTTAPPAPPKHVPSAPPVAAPISEKAPSSKRQSKPPRLVVLTGADGGREFPLLKATLVVGRGDEVDIRVNHTSVSRQHCELHSIDGQFEVVDNGSANGIRVNGQDVKKALLAPGDTLELGDVALKYVPAGQAFVYDASAAEAARELSSRGGRRRGGAVWVLVAIAVAGAAAAGVVLAKQPPGAVSQPPVAAVPETDDLLTRAYRMKIEGDAAAAHLAVKDVPKDDPIRKDRRYVEIENAWADRAIAAVKDEPAVEKKKALLGEILASGADASYRTTAADLLESLDTTAPSPADLPTAGTVAAPIDAASAKPAPSVSALASVKPRLPKDPPPPPPMTTQPAATVATAPVPGGKCGVWKADYSAAMRGKDFECVKTMLLPRLASGAISQPEARFLKAACQALGDTACEKRAAEKL